MSEASHHNEKTEQGAAVNASAPIVADALPHEHKPDPWGPGHKKLYLMCGLVYFCSTMNGTEYPRLQVGDVDYFCLETDI